MYDNVNHPKHYTDDPSGVECIEITRHRSFNVGNAIKYLWRAGRKDASKTVEDLQKAAFYVNDEIKRLGGEPQEPKNQQQAPAATTCTLSLADGVYYIIGNRAVPTSESITEQEAEICTGIGIKMGDKSVVVELQKAAKDDTELTSGQCGSIFYDTRHGAVADYNGKANTEDMAGYLHSNIELFPGQYIPSLGELYLIYLHFVEVNEALAVVHGELLEDKWYWSSTQYSATNAWLLNLTSGGAYFSAKASYQLRVRPVSAFLQALNS